MDRESFFQFPPSKRKRSNFLFIHSFFKVIQKSSKFALNTVINLKRLNSVCSENNYYLLLKTIIGKNRHRDAVHFCNGYFHQKLFDDWLNKISSSWKKLIVSKNNLMLHSWLSIWARPKTVSEISTAAAQTPLVSKLMVRPGCLQRYDQFFISRSHLFIQVHDIKKEQNYDFPLSFSFFC